MSTVKHVYDHDNQAHGPAVIYAVAERDPDLRIEESLDNEQPVTCQRYSTYREACREGPISDDELAERRALEMGRSCGANDPEGRIDSDSIELYSEIGGKIRAELAEVF